MASQTLWKSPKLLSSLAGPVFLLFLFFWGGGTVNGTLNFSFSNHSMLVYGKIIIFFSLFRKILFC